MVWKLTINDTAPMKGCGPMQVSELRDGLEDFNQKAPVVVAIQVTGKPHEIRQIRHAGHLAHEGKVMKDHARHALEIVTDPFDGPPQGEGPVETVGDLAKAIKPFPDPMHVRVAVPVTHETVSHRLLDIVMVGRATGSAGGIQLICEAWDHPMQVIRAKGA